MMLAQTNLLDTSTWTLGTDYLTDFPRYGSAAKNVRELDYGPHSSTEQVIIWKGLPDTTSSNDGGWLTPYFPIDSSRKYRFTVWLRKINSNDGKTYFGFNALDDSENHASLNLDGTSTSNPYFGSSNVSFPSFNEWYLFVAYVYPYTHTSTTNEGGIYSTNGIKVADYIRGFKFASTATQIRHRSFLIDDNNSDELHFYAPTIYEVNGQEPTIQELLDGPNVTDTQSPTAPILSSTGQTETTADLSWSGSTDDTGVTGYKIYRDGSLEATLGNVNSYQITGLTPGTTYSLTAKALDASGNESIESNQVTVVTDPGSGGGSTGSVWTESGGVASYTGNVAIGTSSVPSGYVLAVDGHIRVREIRVDQDVWPDYVFSDDYELLSLEEIRKHIKEKGHLPNIPSAEEVRKNGMELGKMDRLLLENIEELTLHIISLKEEINTLKESNEK